MYNKWVLIKHIIRLLIALLVCFGGFTSHSRMFHSWEVTISREGLQILTYTRYSGPLNWRFVSVPLLLWHGASGYIRSSPGTLNIHTCCRVLLLPVFNNLHVGLSRAELDHPTSSMRCSTYCVTVAGLTCYKVLICSNKILIWLKLLKKTRQSNKYRIRKTSWAVYWSVNSVQRNGI